MKQLIDKFRLLLLIVLLFPAALNAVDSSEFYFQLSPKESQTYYIGFSDSLMDNQVSIPTPHSGTYEMESRMGTTGVYGYTNEVCIYWRMITTSKTVLSLQLSPFSNTEGSLNWTISSEDSRGDGVDNYDFDLEDGILISTENQTIKIHQNLGSPACWGSIRFECVTNPSAVTGVDYSTTMKLILRDDS